MPIKLLKSMALFGRELVTNPRGTGAAFPSSLFLARRMASFIEPGTQSPIVELGPGTGSITQAILERGIAPEQLITIEKSEKLVDHLRKRFPQLSIIHGDASELQTIVEKATGLEDHTVDYIISCLPFRSLPDDVSRAIIDQIKNVLSSTGKLIQFTYDLRTKDYHHFDDFHRQQSSVVIANLPPARVDLFTPKTP